MCDGSDSLHTGDVPKTEHNDGADPKTELEKKLNADLLLVCWSGLLSSSVVFPYLWGSCLSVLVCACLLWGFRGAFFPEEGRRPQNRSLSAGTPLPSSTVLCYGSQVTQYWVRDFL